MFFCDMCFEPVSLRQPYEFVRALEKLREQHPRWEIIQIHYITCEEKVGAVILYRESK